MATARFFRTVGLFASIVGTLQILDAILLVIMGGPFALTKPGAGPLLLAAGIVLIREAMRLRLRVVDAASVRPNGEL